MTNSGKYQNSPTHRPSSISSTIVMHPSPLTSAHGALHVLPDLGLNCLPELVRLLKSFDRTRPPLGDHLPVEVVVRPLALHQPQVLRRRDGSAQMRCAIRQGPSRGWGGVQEESGGEGEAVEEKGRQWRSVETRESRGEWGRLWRRRLDAEWADALASAASTMHVRARSPPPRRRCIRVCRCPPQTGGPFQPPSAAVPPCSSSLSRARGCPAPARPALK